MSMSIVKLYHFKHLVIIQKYKCLILSEIHVNLKLNLFNDDTRDWELFSPASKAVNRPPRTLTLHEGKDF